MFGGRGHVKWKGSCLVGGFMLSGMEWRFAGEPVRICGYDFTSYCSVPLFFIAHVPTCRCTCTLM